MGPVVARLTTLSADDLQRVAAGYASTEKYQVRPSKTEQDGWRFELQPTPVNPPYLKTFRRTQAEVAHLNAVIAGGTSVGAWDVGVLVGIAVTQPMAWNRNLVLLEFHVAEAHRRHGIGRAMMDHVLASARSLGLRSVTAETQNTNMPAIRFYRSCGFTLQGVDMSLYADEHLGEDREVALFMRRLV